MWTLRLEGDCASCLPPHEMTRQAGILMWFLKLPWLYDIGYRLQGGGSFQSRVCERDATTSAALTHFSSQKKPLHLCLSLSDILTHRLAAANCRSSSASRPCYCSSPHKKKKALLLLAMTNNDSAVRNNNRCRPDLQTTSFTGTSA